MKVLNAKYTSYSKFIIPNGINLKDENQVESYGIKWNTLYIYLKDGSTLRIEGSDPGGDFKYPDEIESDEETDEEN